MTLPVENFDADLLMPSVEILNFPKTPEVSGYIEAPASEIVAPSTDDAKVVSDLASPSVLNVTNNVTRTNESGSGEDDIPSFSEWTLKVLAEEEKSGRKSSSYVIEGLSYSCLPLKVRTQVREPRPPANHPRRPNYGKKTMLRLIAERKFLRLTVKPSIHPLFSIRHEMNTF